MSTVTKDKTLDEIIDSVEGGPSLILINDDHNSFQHVIICLVNICRHAPTQAEQCAMITHYKGSCQIKRGPEEELKTMLRGLLEEGLTAEINFD